VLISVTPEQLTISTTAPNTTLKDELVVLNANRGQLRYQWNSEGQSGQLFLMTACKLAIITLYTLDILGELSQLTTDVLIERSP